MRPGPETCIGRELKVEQENIAEDDRFCIRPLGIPGAP